MLKAKVILFFRSYRISPIKVSPNSFEPIFLLNRIGLRMIQLSCLLASLDIIWILSKVKVSLLIVLLVILPSCSSITQARKNISDKFFIPYFFSFSLAIHFCKEQKISG